MWENVVTCCPYKYSKGNRTLKKLGLKFIKLYIPSNSELKEIGRMFPPNFLHQSWNDFLYWDSELEP